MMALPGQLRLFPAPHFAGTPLPTHCVPATPTQCLSRCWVFKDRGGRVARAEYQRPHSRSVPLGLAQMFLAPNLSHQYICVSSKQPPPTDGHAKRGPFISSSTGIYSLESLQVCSWWEPQLPVINKTLSYTHTQNFGKVKNKFVGILCSDLQQDMRKQAIATGNLLKLKKWLSLSLLP